MSNFTWKQPLCPVEQFSVPAEVRGVLEGWEKKRKQHEDLKRTQPATDSAEADEFDFAFKGDSREEELLRLPHRHTRIPPLSIAPSVKPPLPAKAKKEPTTRVLRHPKDLPQLVRTNSKSLLIEWSTVPSALPRVTEEQPPLKSQSKNKKSETHLLRSINEYNERKSKGETHVEALSQTSKYARDIIRDPRRVEPDIEMFSTDQLFSVGTIAKERELEEKMNRLFSSILAKTKQTGKFRSERETGQGKSREAASKVAV